MDKFCPPGQGLSVVFAAELILPLIIATFVLLFLGVFSRRFRDQLVAIPFEILSYICAVWTATYALDLATDSLPVKILLMQIRFLALPFIPVLFLVLVILYTRHGAWLTRRTVTLFLALPVITAVLAGTSPYHELFRYNFGIAVFGTISLLTFTNGPVFWADLFYSYALECAALLLLLVALRSSPVIYRRQLLLFLAAAALPVASDMLFAAGITLFPHYDLTPSFFVISGILILFALFRYRFLDIVPIAHSVIFERMRDPMIVLDRNFRIADFNPAAARVFGLTHDRTLGRRAEEVFFKVPDFAGCMTARIVPETPPQIPDPEGNRVYEIQIEDMQTADDAREARLILLRDVTERSRAEEALRESEAMNRSLIDSLPEYVLVYDHTGIILFVNPSLPAETGYRESDLVGKSIMEFIVPADRATAAEQTRRRMVSGPVPPYELRVRWASGEDRVALVRGVPITFHRIPAFLVVLTDITDLKRAEQGLVEANRKINLLSHITRHDILNQLTAIRGYLALAREQIDSPKTAGNLIARAEETGSRIETIIRFTKEYQDVGVRAPAWQNARALAERAASDIPHEGIRIESSIPAGIEFFADPLVGNVFYTLVDNAVRYGTNLSVIRFSGEVRDRGFVIACTDDGKGIPSEDKERIFEQGFGKNTGLGLFLAREILSITGIQIAETGTPDRGAQFEIRIPEGKWRTADRSGEGQVS